LFERLPTAGNFGKDGLDGRGPNERLGMLVPSGREFFDRGNQIVDAQERTA
jgi:hypothetical protein